MSIPSDTRTSLDQLSTPGSSPLVPFRAARRLAAPPVGTSTLLHVRLDALSRRSRQLPGHLVCRTLMQRDGTFHDSRTESVVFQAALRRWDSDSCHQLLGGVPFPHGYPPASSLGLAADERRFPVSLPSISSEEEPTARTRADRFNVRATSRTLCYPNCQRSVCAYFQRKWAGRRSNPRLRCFKPPLDRLSYQPMLVVLGHEKRPDVADDIGP